jgi:hypothetical protein
VGTAGTGSGCISHDSIETLIRAVVPPGHDRTSALSRFEQVEALLQNRHNRPDTANARSHAIDLIDWLLKKYQAGQLVGGQGTATQQALVALINGILCTVGLPQIFSLDALGEDGAFAIVSPQSPPTDIVTGTQFAGVHVETGSVTQPAVITIRRLPDSPGPLLTQFDQYPLFYEYDVSGVPSFDVPVIVGACQPTSVLPPDPSRLRLAHNVAPFTMGSIEVLPLAPAPFLDCTNAELGLLPGAPRSWLARGERLVRSALAALGPQALEAKAMFGSGVGGSTRNFSPFGAVDTLGIMDGFPPIQSNLAGRNAPHGATVTVHTPTGRPLVGIPVVFTATQGGGAVTGASQVSDANGKASIGSWQLFAGPNALTATATAPPGFGIAPFVFLGTGL